MSGDKPTSPAEAPFLAEGQVPWGARENWTFEKFPIQFPATVRSSFVCAPAD